MEPKQVLARRLSDEGGPAPRPRIRDSVRAFPRTTWILFAGTFVHRLASFVFPFLALYLTRERNMSE